MPLNLEPGAELRQYRIVTLVGRGGMGEVYAADELTRFTRGVIDSPTISPDGRRIAYYRGTSETDIVLLKPRVTE